VTIYHYDALDRLTRIEERPADPVTPLLPPEVAGYNPDRKTSNIHLAGISGDGAGDTLLSRPGAAPTGPFDG
jgi:hypothetical protein